MLAPQNQDLRQILIHLPCLAVRCPVLRELIGVPYFGGLTANFPLSNWKCCYCVIFHIISQEPSSAILELNSINYALNDLNGSERLSRPYRAIPPSKKYRGVWIDLLIHDTPLIFLLLVGSTPLPLVLKIKILCRCLFYAVGFFRVFFV